MSKGTELLGAQGVCDNLDRIVDAMEGSEFVGVFQEMGDLVRNRAFTLAPKRTGFLAAHVHARAYSRNSVPAVLVGVSGVSYAIPVEFGTHDTRPQPFMRPAVEETKQQMYATAANQMPRIIEKAIK